MSRRRPTPDPGPRPVAASLNRVTAGLGAPDATALARLFSRWPEIVGPGVAAHAWPVSLVRGALVVGVDDPVWATQLTYLQTDLRRRLDEALGAGTVTSVQVRRRPR